MARDLADRQTMDMFAAAELYPVRLPRQQRSGRGMTFPARLKRSLSDALKECGKSREVVAAEMAEHLDEPTFSKAMLDAYTAESRETHHISVHRLMALIRVTGAVWLLDVLAEEEGAVVMVGEEAQLAQVGLIEQQIGELRAQLAELKRHAPARPSKPSRRRRS